MDALKNNGENYPRKCFKQKIKRPRVKFNPGLRWPEPIYMRVGYVFDLRFSECKIQPISIIFGILNKK